MGTTADKLQYLIDAKSSISAAIEAKGGTVPQELSGYGPAIEALPSGGGDPEKLTYVLYEDNTISSYLLEGVISGENTSHPCPEFQNGKLVQLGNAVTEIGQFAFYGISTITTVTIPDSVLIIGGGGSAGRTKGAFQNCTGLTSITIPGSVTSIGIGAFRNCSNCLIYDFSNHTSIPTLANVNAFQDTNANKKIIVPDALYETWKTTNNWNSSTNGIVDAITKASEA